MVNSSGCTLLVNTEIGHDIALKCLLKNSSSHCSWKRHNHTIRIDGRYRYVDCYPHKPKPNQDCSIAIKNVSEIDKALWTCEATVGDQPTYNKDHCVSSLIYHPHNCTSIDTTRSTLKGKQSSNLNLSASTTESYFGQNKVNNGSGFQGPAESHNLSNLTTVLYTFAGLIGVLGLAVLVACVVAVIKFFLDSYRRPTTEQKHTENQGSEMERNESARRLLSQSSGASIEPMTDDSAEDLYDDVAQRQPRKKRHRREHRERLPGQTHHNHHHHGHRRRHRRRNYTKMILDSIRASLPVSMASVSLANFPPAPKLPKNINKRTVMETNCSFVNEVTIEKQNENNKVKQGHTKPSSNNGSSTNKTQTTLVNSSVMFDHTSKSRMEARLNASYDVNSSRRIDGPLVGRRFNSTTQLSKQTTPQMKPKFPLPVQHHPKTITIHPMSSQAQSNLPFTKLTPHRQETGGQSTSLTRAPPSLPKYKPKDTKESMAKRKDNEQYEEIESNLSENVYDEVDQVLIQHKMMAEDLYENTFDVTHYENFDHSDNISPTVIVYGNARHYTTSSSQEETPNSQPTNPAKKKKPLPLRRTNITKT